MKEYNVIFQDIFTGATCHRTAQLTDAQYLKAKEQQKDKIIVVNKLQATGTRDQLIIKQIIPRPTGPTFTPTTIAGKYLKNIAGARIKYTYSRYVAKTYKTEGAALKAIEKIENTDISQRALSWHILETHNRPQNY